MALPLADESVDGVVISFGLRNVADPDAALREFRRVTRPGGTPGGLRVLRPTWAPFRTVYLEYLMKALPADRPRGQQQPRRLRLPRRVDPGLARPGGLAGLQRRRLGRRRLAEPHRRHRRAAPGVRPGMTPTSKPTGHKIDVVPSGAHVRVLVAGEVVADSRRSLVLTETGCPDRYYLPAATSSARR